mgnify:CR=1 FL=1
MIKNPFFKNKGPFKLTVLIYNEKTGLNSDSGVGTLSDNVLISDVKNLNDAMSGINTRYIDNLPSTITTITSSREHNQNNILEGNIKNISVLLIEDFQDQKLI